MLSHFPYIQSLKPNPDIDRFIRSLLGKTKTYPAPMVEFIVDEPVIKKIITSIFQRDWVNPGADRESQSKYLDNLIFFWYRMGYDMMHYESAPNYPGTARITANTASGSNATRSWVEESIGAITSWREFELYAFPKIEEVDFSAFEYLNKHLPEGMGLALAHGGGLFERVSWIFSIEKLCYLLYDQPDLVAAVTQKISEIQMDFYRNIMDFDRLSAIFPGDDMGFRSATIISPNDLRKYFLPFHKMIADMAHTRGVPYFLHSCGNLLKIMPDLIETVGIDGKHSFEDAILPVEKFQELFGDRIACLGGMDMNFLVKATQDQIRARVRKTSEVCGLHGRFAIGSGNSIPDYVPVENYLAMVDEAISMKNS
jgi:uroporphyrinogen decarboxylase